MKPFFIHTPSGDLIAFHHIISLDVELSGALDQLRHEVQARTVDGDIHVIEIYQGPDSRDRADRLINELLRQGEVHAFNPRLAGELGPRR